MLTKVIDLVYGARDLVLSGCAQIVEKGSASNVVTDSDVAVQDYLVKGLQELFGDIGFICEESEFCQDPLSHPYTAVIDPIDGTSNFVRNMRLSSISVAVLREGQPWLGVVYQPFTGEMFAAEAGKGATCNGMPIHVSQRPLEASCMCTAWSLYDKSLSGLCFDICQDIYPHMDDFRRLGSAALELCYLACGRMELYFEIRLFPWDIAAGTLIIREAGGFFQLVGLEDADYSQPMAVIAGHSEESFALLKDTVQRHLPQDLYRRDAYAKLY